MSRRIALPPDTFEDIPEGFLWSSEPDDGEREEHEFPADFPEYDDYRDREIAERRYDAEERFAAILELNERAVGL